MLALPFFLLLHGAVEFMDLTLTSPPALILILASKGLGTTFASIFWTKLSRGFTRSMPLIWRC
jgi:hypothetical protein